MHAASCRCPELLWLHAGIINGHDETEGRPDSSARLRWWQAFQEASTSARGCGDEFDEIFQEGKTLATRLGLAALCCLAWILILLELGVMSVLSGLLLLISPFLKVLRPLSFLAKHPHPA